MKFVDNFCRDLHTNISIQFGDTLVRGWFGKISKDRNLQWSENFLMELHFGLLSCCWQRWFSHISKISYSSATAADRYIASQSQDSSPKKEDRASTIHVEVHHLILSILEESGRDERKRQTNLSRDRSQINCSSYQ